VSRKTKLNCAELHTKHANRKCHLSHTHYVCQFACVLLCICVCLCVYTHTHTYSVLRFSCFCQQAKWICLARRKSNACLGKGSIAISVLFVLHLYTDGIRRNFVTEFKHYKGLLQRTLTLTGSSQANCKREPPANYIVCHWLEPGLLQYSM